MNEIHRLPRSRDNFRWDFNGVFSRFLPMRWFISGSLHFVGRHIFQWYSGQLDFLAITFAHISIRSAEISNIKIKQRWSTRNYVGHIDGNNITPNKVLIGSNLHRNQTPLRNKNGCLVYPCNLIRIRVRFRL